MSNTQVMIIRKPPEKTELRDTNHAFIGTFRSDDIDILQDKISITCPRHPEHVMQVPLHLVNQIADAEWTVTTTQAEICDCRYCTSHSSRNEGQ